MQKKKTVQIKVGMGTKQNSFQKVHEDILLSLCKSKTKEKKRSPKFILTPPLPLLKL